MVVKIWAPFNKIKTKYAGYFSKNNDKNQLSSLFTSINMNTVTDY